MSHNYVIENNIIIETKKNFKMPLSRFLKDFELDVYNHKVKDLRLDENKSQFKYHIMNEDGEVHYYNISIKNIQKEDKTFLNTLLSYVNSKEYKNAQEQERNDDVINPRKIFMKNLQVIRKETKEDFLCDESYVYISVLLRILTGIAETIIGLMSFTLFVRGQLLPKFLLGLLTYPLLELGLWGFRECVALFRTWKKTKQDLNDLSGEKSRGLFKSLERKKKRKKVRKMVEQLSLHEEQVLSEEKINKHLEVLEKVNKINKKFDMLDVSSRNIFRQELLSRLNHYSSIITAHVRKDISLKLYDETIETINFIVFLDDLSSRIDTQLEKEKYKNQIENITEEIYDDYTDDLTESGVARKRKCN